MKIEVFDITGKKLEDIQLDKNVFEAKVNQPLMTQAVRVYLSNQREANAHAKTRAEVDRSRRKLYRQKGTGGARHGDRKSPVYVGGGKALGPTGEQNYTLDLPQKMKMAALKSALSLYASEGKIVAVSGLADLTAPKTKTLQSFLNVVLANKDTRKTTIVVAPNMSTAKKSLANIETTNCYEADTLTTYHVLNSNNMIVATEAIESLINRLTK